MRALLRFPSAWCAQQGHLCTQAGTRANAETQSQIRDPWYLCQQRDVSSSRVGVYFSRCSAKYLFEIGG